VCVYSHTVFVCLYMCLSLSVSLCMCGLRFAILGDVYKSNGLFYFASSPPPISDV